MVPVVIYKAGILSGGDCDPHWAGQTTVDGTPVLFQANHRIQPLFLSCSNSIMNRFVLINKKIKNFNYGTPVPP